MTFGKWSEEIHQTPDQKRRVLSAKIAKVIPLRVDEAVLTGVFLGSPGEVYETTLNTCTCADFKNRKLPCKHIYRLAMECNLMDSELKPSNCSSTDISLEDSVEILENYTDKMQNHIRNMLRYMTCNDTGIVRLECNDYGKIVKPISGCVLDDFLDCPFFDYTVASIDMVMGKMAKKDIMNILRKTGNLPKGKMTKAKLIAWCTENKLDLRKDLPLIIIVSCISHFQKVMQETYRFLRRKYEWNMIYVEDETGKNPVFYPYDAEFADAIGNPTTCFFPDDKISDLLSRYGHNRCLGGFDVTKQGPGK